MSCDKCPNNRKNSSCKDSPAIPNLCFVLGVEPNDVFIYDDISVCSYRINQEGVRQIKYDDSRLETWSNCNSESTLVEWIKNPSKIRIVQKCDDGPEYNMINMVDFENDLEKEERVILNFFEPKYITKDRHANHVKFWGTKPVNVSENPYEGIWELPESKEDYNLLAVIHEDYFSIVDEDEIFCTECYFKKIKEDKLKKIKEDKQ